jgi:hypothetical protein
VKAPSVVFAALWMGACAHAPEPEPARTPSAASYSPLAIGDQWTYETNLLGEHRDQVVEIVRKDGAYFADQNGNLLAVDAFGLRDPKRYLLREPLEAGREWTNVVSVSSVEHYRILEVATSCEAPAGKFDDCVRVESRNRVDENTTLVNEVTFAKGVGIARIEVAAENGGKRIPQTQLLLKTYRLASATK